MPDPHRFRAWFFPLVAWLALGLPAWAAEAAPAARAFQWRPFLAPFHSVVLHFPIGFISLVFIFELWRMVQPRVELRPAIRLTLWLSLLSGLAAAALGILRASGGGYQPTELEPHRWLGISVVGATLVTLLFQPAAFREGARRGPVAFYRGSLTLTLGLLMTAGHFGGNLTHGSNYLTANAPGFVRELIADDPPWAAEEAAPAALGEKEQFFVDHVQPVLERRCIRCHGPEKQKADYRLDVPAIALAGGKSGMVAIAPGDPMASELVRLILLPPGDDEVMPPEGKEPVTAEEALAIIRWIQAGAVFPAPRAVSVGGVAAGAQ